MPLPRHVMTPIRVASRVYVHCHGSRETIYSWACQDTVTIFFLFPPAQQFMFWGTNNSLVFLFALFSVFLELIQPRLCQLCQVSCRCSSAQNLVTPSTPSPSPPVAVSCWGQQHLWPWCPPGPLCLHSSTHTSPENTPFRSLSTAFLCLGSTHCLEIRAGQSPSSSRETNLDSVLRVT